jgi:hypothetical protein
VVTKPCYTTLVNFTSMADALIIDRSIDDIDDAARSRSVSAGSNSVALDGRRRRRLSPDTLCRPYSAGDCCSGRRPAISRTS